MYHQCLRNTKQGVKRSTIRPKTVNSFSSIKNQGLIRRRKNKLEKKWSHQNGKLWQSLSEKCTYSEFFWSIFPLWTEYGEILQVCQYLVRMPENADQK